MKSQYTRHGQSWSAEEDRKLYDLTVSGVLLSDICLNCQFCMPIDSVAAKHAQPYLVLRRIWAIMAKASALPFQENQC